MTWRGRIENGVVILQDSVPLADGTWVEVRPLKLSTEDAPAPDAVGKERQEALRELIGQCLFQEKPPL